MSATGFVDATTFTNGLTVSSGGLAVTGDSSIIGAQSGNPVFTLKQGGSGDTDFAIVGNGSATQMFSVRTNATGQVGVNTQNNAQLSLGVSSSSSPGTLVSTLNFTSTSVSLTPPSISTAAEIIGLNHAATTYTITGSYGTQREYLFTAPTYNGAFTLTNSATVAITDAPSGTATLTNKYALWIQAGKTQFDAGVTISTGNLALGSGSNINFGSGNALFGDASNTIISGPASTGTVGVKDGAGNQIGNFRTQASGTIAIEWVLPSTGTVTAETIGFRHAAQTITITGGYATQRFNVVGQPTITAGSALTVTDAATLAIAGAPITGGSAVLTRKYQLWLQGTDKMRVDTTTQSTIGANGAASALTANPLGYLPMYIGTTLVIVPYYNP